MIQEKSGRAGYSVRRTSVTVCQRRGVSLIEMVVSMGLLSVIMLPVISLLATSHKVFSASSARHDGNYLRHTSLDGASRVLAGAESVVAISSRSVEVQFSTGATGELAFGAGRLIWTFGGTAQELADGLSDARFTVSIAPGAPSVAGEIVRLEVASQSVGEPQANWSSTQVWVRPAI